MNATHSFTLGTFNICSAHFQEKRYTDRNLRLIADKIRASGADAVALQEVDRGAERSRGVNMPDVLSELSGLHHHYFIKIRDFQGGEYGTAILSRFPIIEASTINYPVTLATQGTSCGYVVLDVNGWPVTLFNTHLSIESEDANTDTLICLRDILRARLDSRPEGFACCGDFNTTAEKVERYIPFVTPAQRGLITYSDKTSIDNILCAGEVFTDTVRLFDTQYDNTTDHHMLMARIQNNEPPAV